MKQKSRKVKVAFIIMVIALLAGFLVYCDFPINRTGIRSELLMLGDLNNDRKWDDADLAAARAYLSDPFAYSDLEAMKLDVNKNGFIDAEDTLILGAYASSQDPYVSFAGAAQKAMTIPLPREMFKYLPKSEYVQRPLFILRHACVNESPLLFLKTMNTGAPAAKYTDQVLAEIYNEGIRFTLAFNNRKEKLTEAERSYAERKIEHCNKLYGEERYQELLLNLIGLVEDAETLTTRSQSAFVGQLLYFRDHLRALMSSQVYADYETGRTSYRTVLQAMDSCLNKDLSLPVDLDALPPPRDYFKFSNYVERLEWQYYKTTTRNADFEKLTQYAQYDRRYLRAASKTTRKYDDMELQNHNLPMSLLFRESMKIKMNDKKAAVGLLDEAIRIPYGWIKQIPRESLPSSIALENFLLPGNKEDGYDKSRHWNVFGGVSLYKSPEESLILAFQREMSDLRADQYKPESMREFFRDMISNINGIYYVMTIDPNLVYRQE